MPRLHANLLVVVVSAQSVLRCRGGGAHSTVLSAASRVGEEANPKVISVMCEV